MDELFYSVIKGKIQDITDEDIAKYDSILQTIK
jgi:hypothetical protein